MSRSRKLFVLLCVLALVGTAANVTGQAKMLPPGPTFDSTATMADEGMVKPVAKKAPKPMKIAVLGLENNPFWIPVKEGTMKAAKELAPLGCTVDWINAGAQHTTDVFGPAIEAAMAQDYDAIATIAGDSGIVNYINKAVDAGIPVATFNSETATVNKRLFSSGPICTSRASLPASAWRRF